MINLRKYFPADRREPEESNGGWRLELRPVRVEGHHNLHAIYCQQDGSTTSQLLLTHLDRSQMQTALAAAMAALERHFAGDPGYQR